MSADFRQPTAADWEASWRATGESISDKQYLKACKTFEAVLDPHLERYRGRRALEIGCYPGGFAAWMSNRYELEVSGFDFIVETPGLANLLSTRGARIGKFWQADLRTEKVHDQFDVVASFGFVEHFWDLNTVICQQARWLAPGGIIIVAVPRFRGLQWVAHRLTDRKNLERHNISTMSRSALGGALISANLNILQISNFGTSEFWVEPDTDRGPKTEWLASQFIRLGGGVARRVRECGHPGGLGNPVTSPFIVAIARRGRVRLAQ